MILQFSVHNRAYDDLVREFLNKLESGVFVTEPVIEQIKKALENVQFNEADKLAQLFEKYLEYREDEALFLSLYNGLNRLEIEQKRKIIESIKKAFRNFISNMGVDAQKELLDHLDVDLVTSCNSRTSNGETFYLFFGAIDNNIIQL